MSKSPHAPVREDWLALHEEPVLEPELPIVDPHHHLWDPPGGRYLLDELTADLKTGHNVVATVFMECSAMLRQGGDPDFGWVGETEFVNGVAAMSASGAYGPARACAAIIGRVDLTIGAKAREVLEAHVAAGGGRFRGVRNNGTWDPDPSLRSPRLEIPQGLLRQRDFREGFAELAKLGLSMDSWLYHQQIADLADLARAFPDATIVLDHIGGPLGVNAYAGKRAEIFEFWRARIREIAQCPNVVVKLGGMGMTMFGFGFEAREKPPSSEEMAEAWRPYYETCVEAFGTKRCMFESNFPVDKGYSSYPVLWNAFKRLAAGCSADEKADLFSRTAARTYRIAL
jgi:predicted TIM-barrel fold metal-dependent hydrolase